MKIDIKKAYDYYINNINKSCDNRVLDEKSFHEAFSAFLQQLQIDEVMNRNTQYIPIYNDKCKTSRIVNLETVLNKIR
jgi:hypothetical protein